MFKSTRSIGSKKGRPALALEPLEDRTLMSVGITEFPVPSGFRGPADIVKGPDGNLWFTQSGGGYDVLPYNNALPIGRITPDGQVSGFPVPTRDASVAAITAGPDGNLWFTESVLSPNPYHDLIGRMTPAGVVTEFPAPADFNEFLGSITTGPDGNLWFTDGQTIGRMTPAGDFTSFAVSPGVNGLAPGPDGNIWFTQTTPLSPSPPQPPPNPRIGRITPSGQITEFSLPSTGPDGPWGITTGPDGNLWFTQDLSIGRITPDGQITQFPLPAGRGAVNITPGPDGNLWFTEVRSDGSGWGYIGRITPQGVITEYPTPTSIFLPGAITTGPDGNIWFTEDYTKIGRLTLNAPDNLQTPGTVIVSPDNPSSNVLATFPASMPNANAANYSATVIWGDGTQSTASVTYGPAGFEVTGSHLYAAPGSFSATVMLHDLSANITTFASASVMVRSPQEAWVRQLYQDLLQRPADDAGVTAWLAQLAGGVSRLQVVHEFEGSLEYRTRVVENLYATLLGRPADPVGLAGFVQFLGQGGTAQQVEAAILSSAEYYQNRAGQDPGSFLSALYHDVLARPVDDIGAVRWSELLALGFGRDLVVSLVLSSAEAQRDQIEAVYQQFLGRPADPTGMNGFASSLAQGASLGDVLAAIASSDEFFQRM